MAKKTKYGGLSLLILIVVIISLIGCTTPTPTPTQTPSPTTTPKPTQTTTPTPTPTPKLPSTIQFSTTPSGSTMAIATAAVADLISKYTPMKASFFPTSGSAECIQVSLKGDSDLAFGGDTGAYKLAYEGTAPYVAGKGIIRALWTVYSATFHEITLESSGIKTFLDLKGKTFMLKAPGSVSERLWPLQFQAWGLTENDMKVVLKPAHAEAMQALRDGTVDAVGLFSVAPASVVQEVDVQKPIYWIPMGEEKAKWVAARDTFPAMKVPAGTYKGMKEDIWVNGIYSPVSTVAAVPDEVIYQVVKTMWGHLDELKKAYSGFSGTNFSDSLGVDVIPFHAGAIRYYKEIGVWTPAMEARNKALLDKYGLAK